MSRTILRVACIAVLAQVVSAPALAQAVESRQIGEMVFEGVPPWSDELRQRMLQYLQTRAAGLQDIAEDGESLLISTRFGDTSQLHLVSQPLGARKQITFYDEPVGGASFIPQTGGREVLLVSDVGGAENYQCYRLDLATGRRTLLTDGKSRHEGMTLARDGRTLAFSGTGRNGRDHDIYTFDLGAIRGRATAETAGDLAAPKRVWEVEGSYGPSDFSPDGSKLLVMKDVSVSENHWFVFDVASGKSTPLTPPSPPAYYENGAWSADGKSIFICSDREGEFNKLYRVDLPALTWTCLTPDIEWDIERVAIDLSGAAIAFVANEDGISRLYFANPDGAARRPVQGLPTGVIGRVVFSGNGQKVALSVNSALSPSDAYTVHVADGRVTRWTESEIGGLNSNAFIEPSVVHFPTFDSVNGKPREIPALYYKSPAPGPRPVVITCHGGPESQYRPTFSGQIQYWATELGISVLAPNVRGSTGYGKSFHRLDDGVKREDSVRDIGALLDWIATQPDLDKTRVGIMGGSYGGYMVMGSLVNFPERFRAGIDIVGITDFVTFLENTSEYRRDLRRVEYGDERDPAVRKVLEQISPLRRADRIQAALLVAHGQNDPRVPIGEAKQIVAKMREMKRPVWFLNALNEGHGFQKKQNSDLAAISFTHFWKEQLLK